MISRLEPATDDNVSALVALRAAVAAKLTAEHGRGPWSHASSEKGVRFDMRNTELLVVRHGVRLVGTLSLTTKKPWAIDLRHFRAARRPLYLLSMAVAPEFQRQGIGRLCLGGVFDLCRERSVDAVRLDAYDATAGAGLFYAKCGFHEVGRASYRNCPLVYFERLL